MARRGGRTSQETVEYLIGGIGGSVPYIAVKSGKRIHFWDAVTMTEAAHTALGTAFSRAFKLAVAEKDPYYLEVLERRIEKVEEHMGALRDYLAKLRGKQSKRERIALLRQVNGRSPEEAKAFLAKADQLERELDG